MGCLIEVENTKSKKVHNSEKKKKMHFELSPLIVWIALWIVNTYSEFQVNIFSNKRDVLQNVKVFARRQGYTNTSRFLRKQLS